MPRRPFRAFNSGFCQNAEGVSAIEFALVFPLLLTILFGTSEFANAIDNWRKVTQLARTVADLTSQGDTQTPISLATMNDIMASAKLVVRPFDGSTAKIVVSALGVDLVGAGQKPRVCSSFATSNTTARSAGIAGDLTIQPGFQLPGMRYILAEVSMAYSPIFGSGLMKLVGNADNQFTFRATTAWPVRAGKKYKTNIYDEVVLPSGAACP